MTGMQISLIVRGQHPPGDTAAHLRDDLERGIGNPTRRRAALTRCRRLRPNNRDAAGPRLEGRA